jgi:hypothetical protein
VRQLDSERRFSKLAAAINQKAKRLGQSGRISPGGLARVFLSAEGQCTYCGIEIDWRGVSFDHIVPYAKGGQNVEENLAASCITCQRTKFTKTTAQHEAWMTYTAQCEVCGRTFKPRFSDYQRGYGKTCSRVCSGTKGGQVEKELSPA